MRGGWLRRMFVFFFSFFLTPYFLTSLLSSSFFCLEFLLSYEYMIRVLGLSVGTDVSTFLSKAQQDTLK